MWNWHGPETESSVLPDFQTKYQKWPLSTQKGCLRVAPQGDTIQGWVYKLFKEFFLESDSSTSKWGGWKLRDAEVVLPVSLLGRAMTWDWAHSRKRLPAGRIRPQRSRIWACGAFRLHSGMTEAFHVTLGFWRSEKKEMYVMVHKPAMVTSLVMDISRNGLCCSQKGGRGGNWGHTCRLTPTSTSTRCYLCRSCCACTQTYVFRSPTWNLGRFMKRRECMAAPEQISSWTQVAQRQKVPSPLFPCMDSLLHKVSIILLHNPAIQDTKQTIYGHFSWK